MKITIELNTGDPQDATLARIIAAAMQGTPETPEEVITARNTARELQAEKGTADTTQTADEPTARVYGETSEGKARRTKVEMAQDENIEELFAKAKELGAKGLPKAIPTDISADAIYDELVTMIEVLKDDETEDDDGGFEVDDDTPTTEDPMDLDEFRAILTKGVKELGGKDVGALMKPYKSATDVPVDERNEYAQKLKDAM